MDINYILGREQISLHNALIAKSAPARIAHQALADAYGALLVKAGFPHRSPKEAHVSFRNPTGVTDWENEGGALRWKPRPLPYPIANHAEPL